jgi:adenylosuccinate synthase
MCDLLGSDLESRLRALIARLGTQLEGTDANDAVNQLLLACRQWGERLEPLVCDTGRLLNEWIDDGVGVLFEGAQGALLDLDHGTYPYVSSSSATAGGASTGTGVGPTRMDGVLGVLKAYTTRVGSGPFTTELHDESGEFMRERGAEFGTTTGRPRRCGWLDLVAARYGARVNDVTAIALTKLDILDPLDEIPVCIGYKTPHGLLNHFPADLETLEQAEPMYEILEGWGTSTEGILDYVDLPEAVKAYVAFIEERVGAPVGLVSTGPKREQTILRHDSPLNRLTDGRLQAILAGQQNV